MKDGSVHRDSGGWTRLGFLTALFLLGALFAEPRPSSMPPGLRDFLDRNCVSCHRTANAPEGLDLNSLQFDLEDLSTFSRWVRIHDQVRDGVMPPGGALALKPPDRSAFLKIVGEPMKSWEQRDRAHPFPHELRGRVIRRSGGTEAYAERERIGNAPHSSLSSHLFCK